MIKKTLSPIQVMIELIKYKPVLYLFDALLWITIHLFPLIPGLLVKLFLDTLTNEASINIGIWGIIAIFISFSLMRVVFIIVGFRVDIYHRFNMSGLLRRNLLAHMLKHISNSDLQTTSGEMISNYRDDVEQIEESISWFLDIMGTLLFAIIAISILLTINIKITIYVFFPLMLVIIIGHSFSKKIHRYRIASREATALVTSAIGETFTSIQAIKVSSSEESVMKHIKTLNDNRHKMMLKDTLFNQILDSVYFNTVNIGTGFILLITAQTINTESFSVGDFSLFIYYLAFVSDFILFFGYFIARYQQIKVSVVRLQSLLNGDKENSLARHNPLYLNEPSPLPIYHILNEEDKLHSFEVKDLTYIYPGSENGIHHINFSVKRGSFVVVTGRVASGKSTLLKVILGLISKDEGEILYNGNIVSKPDEYLTAPRVAYTPQIPKLFSDTVLNNILLGLEKDSVEIEKAIYRAVLEPDIKQLENGINTMVGPKGVKLSGGQVQRVAAARMFVRDSELFLLDDISSAIDVDTEKELWNRLFETKGKTCIVVSNKKIALQYATQIIVLKNGKIEALGKLEELLVNCEELKKIWNT